MAEEIIKNTNTVDIVQSHAKMEYFINLDGEIGEPESYRQVVDILRKATHNDIVNIIINTPGGVLNTGIQLYNSIRNCQAHVTAIIYEASSAGSLIAFACDEIKVAEFGYMMIHSLSTGVFGKQEDIKNMTDFLCKWGDSILGVYKGFLTAKELEEVKKGKEIWLSKQDVEKRLEKWSSGK